MKCLPKHSTGVLVSLNPRNIPWTARETTTAGAPMALSDKNCSAGIRIGEAYEGNNYLKRIYQIMEMD